MLIRFRCSAALAEFAVVCCSAFGANPSTGLLGLLTVDLLSVTHIIGSVGHLLLLIEILLTVLLLRLVEALLSVLLLRLIKALLSILLLRLLIVILLSVLLLRLIEALLSVLLLRLIITLLTVLLLGLIEALLTVLLLRLIKALLSVLLLRLIEILLSVRLLLIIALLRKRRAAHSSTHIIAHIAHRRAAVQRIHNLIRLLLAAPELLVVAALGSFVRELKLDLVEIRRIDVYVNRDLVLAIISRRVV